MQRKNDMKQINFIKHALIAAVIIFTTNTHILYAAPVESLVTDKGNGLYIIDAKASNPKNYKKITGFTITARLATKGSIGGGALNINALLVSQGVHTADEFTMDYDGGIPRYAGKSPELVTFCDYEGATMFFKHAQNEVFITNPLQLTYKGDKALFTDKDSCLTVSSIFGQFEVTDVLWYCGDIKAGNTDADKDWPVSVKTIKYPDLKTCANGNAYNYVDIEEPEGCGPFPVILWIHGGGWQSLSRKSCFIRDTMNYLISKGYAVASADYTLSINNNGIITSGYPQMIYDLKAAVRFLRANAKQYNLDTRFIAAMGESAGGHLAQLLGTTNGKAEYENLSMGNESYSSDVQLIVSYFGPTELTGLFGIAALGNNASDELGEAGSPYYQVNKNTPPIFLTHGRNDQTVPFQQSVDMEAKAKALIGAENVVTVFYDNAPHASIAAYDTKSAAQKVEQFITANWKKTQAK